MIHQGIYYMTVCTIYTRIFLTHSVMTAKLIQISKLPWICLIK